MSATTQPVQTDKAARLTQHVLDELFGSDGAQKVGVRLWDGTPWPDDQPRPATIVLKHPGALRQMFLPGTELGLAEAYLYDDFDVEGRIEAVFDLAETLSQGGPGLIQKLGLARDLLRLPAGPKHEHGRRGRARLDGQQHSVERARQAVRYHYGWYSREDTKKLWRAQR